MSALIARTWNNGRLESWNIGLKSHDFCVWVQGFGVNFHQWEPYLMNRSEFQCDEDKLIGLGAPFSLHRPGLRIIPSFHDSIIPIAKRSGAKF
jgi:hypothetical protein